MTVAAVHLVRHANPPLWLEGFLASYRAHSAGVDHQPVFILKGFDDPAPARRTIDSAIAGARFIEIDDQGFDINAYRHAAGLLSQDRVCFLNSHARIEAPDWLTRLTAPLDDPDIAATAASGSYEALDQTTPFPNPHLRTNGFAIRRTDFLALDFGPLATKRDCNRFEAGPDGMTAQLLRAGRDVAVCGRQGALPHPDWPGPGLFRTGTQENLLISDNRTRAFDQATNRKREKLARLAWGDRAAPARRAFWDVLRDRLGRTR